MSIEQKNPQTIPPKTQQQKTPITNPEEKYQIVSHTLENTRV